MTHPRTLLLTLALGVAVATSSLDAAVRPAPPGPSSIGFDALRPSAPEPPIAQVDAGDPAPDFSFQSDDGHWLHLHDLLTQGSVLLVLTASDAPLRALQQERDALAHLGVVPVAVVERRTGALRTFGRREHITYALIPDPGCVIGTQFNAIHPTTAGMLTSWFVIDPRGRVRALQHGALPETGFATTSARALGIPSESVTLPSSANRPH